MGKEVKLSQIEVKFGPGITKAEIYLGNSGPSIETSSTALSSFTLVSGLASATGDHTFNVSSDATGRYVLIWLTSLPPRRTRPQPSNRRRTARRFTRDSSTTSWCAAPRPASGGRSRLPWPWTVAPTHPNPVGCVRPPRPPAQPGRTA